PSSGWAWAAPTSTTSGTICASWARRSCRTSSGSREGRATTAGEPTGARRERFMIVVVGGGVVGVCATYYLAKRGLPVTLVEKRDIGAGSSYGTAGLIVPSHSVPLAAPGALQQGLRWLLDPESPFYIRPRPSRDLVRWLWRFRRSCTE